MYALPPKAKRDEAGQWDAIKENPQGDCGSPKLTLHYVGNGKLELRMDGSGVDATVAQPPPLVEACRRMRYVLETTACFVRFPSGANRLEVS